MKFLDKENTTEVLFSDNHLLIVNKLAGMLTQPNTEEAKSLEGLAKNWIKHKENKPRGVFLHCIHRIDKPVSGIVVFAKTSKALSRMQQLVRNKEITRKYLALVRGKVITQGRVEHYLQHGSHKALVCEEKDRGAKKACLEFTVVEALEEASFVDIRLETGRYHQIRAQFAAMGHPILGDQKYGDRAALGKPAIALHQYSLAFIHPVTHKEVAICAIWHQLESYTSIHPLLVQKVKKYEKDFCNR